MTGIETQLREKGLKATPARMGVMRQIGDAKVAYSHADLEARFERIDRVTLYRALKDLEDHGLVHKVVDAEGVTRFARCGDNCGAGHHTDDHVHFNCLKCHKMFCLEHAEAPPVKIPAGFTAVGMQTVVYGFCSGCGPDR